LSSFSKSTDGRPIPRWGKRPLAASRAQPYRRTQSAQSRTAFRLRTSHIAAPLATTPESPPEEGFALRLFSYATQSVKTTSTNFLVIGLARCAAAPHPTGASFDISLTISGVLTAASSHNLSSQFYIAFHLSAPCGDETLGSSIALQHALLRATRAQSCRRSEQPLIQNDAAAFLLAPLVARIRV